MGTNSENQTLSTPKNEEELLEAMAQAVSEGNDTELSRLMALETVPINSPDAIFEEDDQDDDAADKAATSTDNTDEEDQTTNTDDSASTEGAADEAATNTEDKTKTKPQSQTKTEEAPKPSPEFLAMQQEIQRLKSNAGRVDHLQSEISRLGRELQKAQKTAAKAASQVESPEQRQFNERIKALKEIDPAQAEMLEYLASQARAAQQTPEDNDADDTIATTAAKEADEETVRAFRVVEQAHPDAVAVFRHPSWKAWKATLDPEKLSWAESDEPGKVITALHAFKNAYAQQQNATTQSVNNGGGDPVTTTTSQTGSTTQDTTAEADKTRQARERKLQENGANRNTPIKSKGPVDETAMFNEMYEQILKENHIK